MFQGVYTAIVTPFKQNGQLDEEALRGLVDFQVKNNVAGIVPCGTTGESPTLHEDEMKRVIEIVVEQAKGKCKVIAGAGANSTEKAIKLSKTAKEVGADATLHVSPYYNKPTQEGLYRHFTAIAEAVE